MKTYLNKLASDFDKLDSWLDGDKYSAAMKRITGALRAGSKCAWCYEDDLKWWKSQGMPMPHPKDWPYSGFIMPFPNFDARGEMELDQVCLVITDYPMEKENPETDWACLPDLFNNEHAPIHRFYVFSNVVTQQAKP